MTTLIAFGDIVEANGKTIRENRLAVRHAIPLGALVELKWDEWHGGGACRKTHARLWVVEHQRDCDGSPLYGLCRNRCGDDESLEIAKAFFAVESGFAEEQLTPIEVTSALEYGIDALQWQQPSAPPPAPATE